MSSRSNVAPSTLEVDLVDGGIVVRYIDGREVFYHGPPEAVETTVRTPPGKDVHVLVTDQDGIEGIMTYVNDLKTDDEILESSGVGRLLVEPEETVSLFPGVTVSREGYAVRVEADHELVEGRVFVFAEDQFGERAYELVAESDDTGEAA